MPDVLAVDPARENLPVETIAVAFVARLSRHYLRDRFTLTRLELFLLFREKIPLEARHDAFIEGMSMPICRWTLQLHRRLEHGKSPTPAA